VPKSVSRDELVAYLDTYLRIADVPDRSPNGLQVQGRNTVQKIAYAVDASAQTIEAATRAKADMLVVHHGLYWGRHEQIVGNMHRRVAGLIRGDLSLYVAHIPLDCHPEVGNNVELARLFGLEVKETFGEHDGIEVGVIAVAKPPVSRTSFTGTLTEALNNEPDVLTFGPSKISRVAIVSGGAAMLAEDAGRAGCDTLVTGESSHSAYHMAQEAAVNLYFGGHYATETVGLRALERHLRKKFSTSSRFIPAPTGY